MKTINYPLSELLRRAKDGSITIPQFQRPFVWRPSQVKLLIDSISRSYPIGSLLLLDENRDLELASRNIQAEIRDGYPPNDIIENNTRIRTEVKSYILDGQQRTTSIARVFLNAHPRKCYYFDLKRLLESHHAEETSWIRERQRGKKEPPDRKDNNRLLRADIILDQAKADIYVSEYIEDSGDFPTFATDRTEARKAAARIKGVFETMRNYTVPVVTLEQNSGIEAVCRVFETINSTGTRLTTFDLAVARFYPEPDLRQFWENTLERHPILKTFNTDGERILQVLYLVASAHNKKYPDPTRSNLLALTPDELRKDWAKSSMALAETYKWARGCGARPETLPNHNVLVALAAVKSLFLDDVSQEIWKNHDFIRRWYFSKVMQAGASQASNYRIGQDFEALRRYVKEDKQPAPAKVFLNPDVVLEIKPSDVRYKSLQNIFATTIRQDLISGNKIDSESTLHDHHIFPRNSGRRYQLPQKLLDGICNRIPILEKSNQTLNEAYPQDYFQRMADAARSQGTMDGLQRRLNECMIPGDPADPSWPNGFSIENFENFIQKRAKLILSRVKEVVGESLRSDSTSEDESEEGDGI